MAQKKIGAFFDFDKTLLTRNSGSLAFTYLYDKGDFPWAFFLKISALNIFYKTHVMSEQTMARFLLDFYIGKRLEDFERDSPDFYENYLAPNLAPLLVRRIAEHKKQGHVLVLISGSIDYYLKHVAQALEFDRMICTRLETGPDGLLTGRTRGPLVVDANKKILAEELARELGLDMAASYAYGNHQADIPLLESVGNPFCVEPTRPLKRVAKRRGWPIIGFYG